MNKKDWAVLAINLFMLLGNTIVTLTPTKVDDELFDKVREIVPIVLAQLQQEE